MSSELNKISTWQHFQSSDPDNLIQILPVSKGFSWSDRLFLRCNSHSPLLSEPHWSGSLPMVWVAMSLLLKYCHNRLDGDGTIRVWCPFQDQILLSLLRINTLLVVYRFCPLSTDNFSHLWCITFILFLLHFLYLRLWLPALIVLGNPWVCTWRKWTRETTSHFIARFLQSQAFLVWKEVQDP